MTYLRFAAFGWLLFAALMIFLALVAAAVSINVLFPLGAAALVALALAFTLGLTRPGIGKAWVALAASLMLVAIMLAALLTAQDAFRGESTWGLGLALLIAALTAIGLQRIRSQSRGS